MIKKVLLFVEFILFCFCRNVLRFSVDLVTKRSIFDITLTKNIRELTVL